MLPRVLLLSLAVGCGGIVVFDPTASDDGGGGASDNVGGGSTGATSPVNPTCVAFCAATAEAQCASVNCESTCGVLFNGECDDTIRPFLECVPDILGSTCVAGFPEDPQAPCTVASDDLSCSSSCGDGSATLQGVGCVGQSSCDFGVVDTSCGNDGVCTCSLNGTFLGSCNAILAGVYGCIPALNCCKLLIPEL